jgi:hypothetical protein
MMTLASDTRSRVEATLEARASSVRPPCKVAAASDDNAAFAGGSASIAVPSMSGIRVAA